MTDVKVFGCTSKCIVTGETRHEFQFASLEAGLAYIQPRDGSAPVGVPWWVGKQHGRSHRNDGWATTIEQAILAIEMELLAIREAIGAALPRGLPETKEEANGD